MDYETLENYYKEHSLPMQKVMADMEESITKARDENQIPIYLTRARVKTLDSAYLKTKRKDKSTIESITDFIGVRVLCLFEQDIYKTFQFLLKMCDDRIYNLNEVLVYGWDKTVKFERIFDEVVAKSEIYEKDKITWEASSKDSGYKSIHLVGSYYHSRNKKYYTFEIQLRTLLQDVWGEMEHKLAYKQKGKQKIVQNSFHLLARDLQTNDMLLSQLKDIIKSGKCYETKPPFNPGSVFKYEDERLPKAFTDKDSPLYSSYREYVKLVYSQDFLHFNSESFSESEKKLDALVASFYREYSSLNKDVDFNYWKNMEEAFFCICKKTPEGLEKAKKIYESLKNNSYVSAFRLGQIALYDGHLTNALRNFDSCKKLLGEDSVKFNKMKIHVNIALILWSHGGEYLSSALDAIDEAVSIAESGSFDYSVDDYETLYNNACWYYMECSFSDMCKNKKRGKDKTSRELAEYYYIKLLNIVHDEEKKGNKPRQSSIDTLAWFNYKLYQEKEDIKHLEMAKDFAERIKFGQEPVNAYISHEETHNEHIRDIICDYNRNMA